MPLVIFRYQDQLFKQQMAEGETITVGSNPKKDTIQISELQKGHIKLQMKYGQLRISGKSNPEVRTIVAQKNEMVHLIEEFKCWILWMDERGDFKQTYQLPYFGEVYIGAAYDNQIMLRDSTRRISRHHCVLRMENGEAHLSDGYNGRPSTNGTFVNGKKITKALLKSGDVIDLLTVRIRMINGELRFENTGNGVEFNDFEANSNRTVSVPKAQKPDFHRSPRVREELPREDLVLAKPPTRMGEVTGHRGSFATLISSGAMVATSLAMGVASPALLAARAASMIAPASMLVSGKSQDKKAKQKAEEYATERQERYSEYIAAQLARIQQIADKQREILAEENPPPERWAMRAEKLRYQIWERSPEDNDFMTVRLGMGYDDLCVRVRSPLEAQNQIYQMDTDDLEELIEQIVEETRLVDKIPARLSLRAFPTVGVIGSRPEAAAVVKNMIVCLAATHYYRDLKIVGFFDEEEEKLWEALRWLPQIWDDEKQIRFLSFNQRERERLCDIFEDLMRQRSERTEEDGPALPHYLFLVGTKEMEFSSLMQKWLLSNRPELGVSTIFLCEDRRELPRKCCYQIDLTPKEPRCPIAFPTAAKNRQFSFTPDPAMRPEDFDAFCRMLSAIRVQESEEELGFPSAVTFLQGVGAERVEDINVWQNWQNSRPWETLSAPFALLQSGKTFSLDILDGADGPHGLVAGTTGSGKSELMKSWLLSVAMHYSPEDVSFLVIDYKGGGMANELADLPHLVGTITNLDGDIYRPLYSLNAEKLRRMRIFGECRVSNIKDYDRGVREGRFTEKLPRLLIVTDEFRELKKNEPEFLNTLISIATVGRTLGMHLVLATQSPNGIVDDQLRDNMRLKICLRVENAAASRDMIGIGDAAKLTQSGRALLKVGNEDCVMIQSFWCGAPYLENRSNAAASGNQVRLVLNTGERIKTVMEEKTRFKSSSTEMDVLARHIRRTVEAHGLPSMPCPWLPPLPKQLTLPKLEVPGAFDAGGWKRSLPWLSIPVGKYDVPAMQEQGPLILNLADEGHYAIYGIHEEDRSNFLRTIMASAGLWYTPSDVNIYILSFSNANLLPFREMPHVGDVLLRTEEEKFPQLFLMLEKEIFDRQAKFSKQGVSTLQEYRLTSGEDLPAIILAVDNMVGLLQEYPDSEQLIIKIGQNCDTLGIYLIFTANNQTGITYKLLNNIKSCVCFEMADQNEYRTIVGRPAEIAGLPSANLNLSPHIAGRGYWKSTEPILFQTAIWGESKDEFGRNQELRELFQQMDRAWTGNRPGKTVSAGDVLSVQGLAEVYKDPYVIPVGCAGESLEPVFLDLASRSRAAILGEAAAETAAYLRLLIRMAHAAFPEISILCLDASGGDMEPIRPLCSRFFSVAEADSAMAALTEIWDTREKELLPIEMRPARWLVFVHQICRIPFIAEEEQIKPLLRLINNNNGRKAGVVLLASGIQSDFARDSKEHQVIYKLLTWRDAVAVSGIPKQYKDSLDFPFEIGSPDYPKALLPNTGVRYQAETSSVKIKLLREE